MPAVKCFTLLKIIILTEIKVYLNFTTEYDLLHFFFWYIPNSKLNNRRGFMKNFLTVEQAKKNIKELQIYVNLAETSIPQCLKEKVIKEYAFLGSLQKVSHKLDIEVEIVRDILKEKSENQLHKIIRTGYMKRAHNSKK